MKKPTQKEELLEAFKTHNNVLTLGTMLNYSWGYTARNRVSELRSIGYDIQTISGDMPSQNGYRLVSAPAAHDPQGELPLNVRADYEH